MPDITMCDGGKCPRKHNCYRYTATPSERRQSYFSFAPYNHYTRRCDYYEEVSCDHEWKYTKHGLSHCTLCKAEYYSADDHVLELKGRVATLRAQIRNITSGWDIEESMCKFYDCTGQLVGCYGVPDGVEYWSLEDESPTDYMRHDQDASVFLACP